MYRDFLVPKRPLNDASLVVVLPARGGKLTQNLASRADNYMAEYAPEQARAVERQQLSFVAMVRGSGDSPKTSPEQSGFVFYSKPCITLCNLIFAIESKHFLPVPMRRGRSRRQEEENHHSSLSLHRLS